MQKVFAEVGSSLQQIGGDCPEGWIEMSEQRPDATSTAQADGTWAAHAAPTVEQERERARAALNPLRDTFLNRLAGIAVFTQDEAAKAECAELRTALLDITKDPAFLAAETYAAMEAALLTAYRNIAINAPDVVRNVFRELEV